MTEVPIYIEMDEEIECLLASDGWSSQKILHKEGIKASVTYGGLPYQDEKGARTKDVALIIMAGGAAAYLISKAITNILKESHHKPIYDTYYELVPVTDAKGNIVKNKETGEPFMRLKKEHFVFEPGKTPGEEQSEVSAGLKTGLVMKFKTKQPPSEQ